MIEYSLWPIKRHFLCGRNEICWQFVDGWCMTLFRCKFNNYKKQKKIVKLKTKIHKELKSRITQRKLPKRRLSFFCFSFGIEAPCGTITISACFSWKWRSIINSSKKFLATCKSQDISKTTSYSANYSTWGGADTSPAYCDTKLVKIG